MNEALLGVLSALVATLIFVVKWLVSRSDKNLESCQASNEVRDQHIGDLVKVCTAAISRLDIAVGSFAAFEKHEEKTHEQILNRLDRHEDLLNGISATQARTVDVLNRMIDRLEAKS